MSETRPETRPAHLLDAYDTDIECRTYLEEFALAGWIACPRCSLKTISRIKGAQGVRL